LCYTYRTRGEFRPMKKVKDTFDKVVAWDRRLARKFQDKFNLTDYQMLVVSFAKGFVIGAILL